MRIPPFPFVSESGILVMQTVDLTCQLVVQVVTDIEPVIQCTQS